MVDERQGDTAPYAALPWDTTARAGYDRASDPGTSDGANHSTFVVLLLPRHYPTSCNSDNVTPVGPPSRNGAGDPFRPLPDAQTHNPSCLPRGNSDSSKIWSC